MNCDFTRGSHPLAHRDFGESINRGFAEVSFSPCLSSRVSVRERRHLARRIGTAARFVSVGFGYMHSVTHPHPADPPEDPRGRGLAVSGGHQDPVSELTQSTVRTGKKARQKRGIPSKPARSLRSTVEATSRSVPRRVNVAGARTSDPSSDAKNSVCALLVSSAFPAWQNHVTEAELISGQFTQSAGKDGDAIRKQIINSRTFFGGFSTEQLGALSEVHHSQSVARQLKAAQNVQGLSSLSQPAPDATLWARLASFDARRVLGAGARSRSARVHLGTC